MNKYFVHESSYIDDNVEIGEGTKIWHFSHVMSDSKIGKNCNIGQNVVISPEVIIGNDVKIQNNVSVYTGVICEDDVFLGPSCVFTNVINPRSFISRKDEYKKTIIKKGASIGANATIVCGHNIGEYAFIGAGSVVTHDVPDYALVVGNPARVKYYVCECSEKMQFIDDKFTCKKCGKRYTIRRRSSEETMKEELLRKIEEKTIVVGVVGLGYVGLPLAVEKAKAGFKTIGFEVQQSKVDLVNKGVNYIGDVVDDELKDLVKNKMLVATTDFRKIKDVDFVAICVPTPLDEHQQPDISYVEGSSRSVAKYLSKNTMVVLESTTYPGTTEELLKPILEEESGLVCGKDFYLGFSPERVDPGNEKYKTKNTPKVVGAIGKDATEVIAKMYRAVLGADIYEVSSPAVAEMEKILENTYRNINIGLVNELAQLCNKMGISMWEVVDAAKTKPYGFQAFYPGPGLGGHCIPLDPYYLDWKAREYGFHTSLIQASGMINDKMPEYCVERASKMLSTRFKKSMNGAKVLVLGIAYKNDIDDYRESPALRVIEELEKEGAIVEFYDPLIPEYKYKGQIHKGLKSIDEKKVKAQDLVIFTAAHSAYDYKMIAKNAKAIFDTRNALKNIKNKKNIELL